MCCILYVIIPLASPSTSSWTLLLPRSASTLDFTVVPVSWLRELVVARTGSRKPPRILCEEIGRPAAEWSCIDRKMTDAAEEKDGIDWIQPRWVGGVNSIACLPLLVVESILPLNLHFRHYQSSVLRSAGTLSELERVYYLLVLYVMLNG